MEKDTALIKLESLLDLSHKLYFEKSETNILNSALLSLMGKLKISRGCIFIKDNFSGSFKNVISKGKSCPKDFSQKEMAEMFSNSTIITGGFRLLNKELHFALPIYVNNELYASICLGNKLDKKEIDETEQRYANLVCLIAGNAIANAKNLVSLSNAKSDVERRNQLLTTLFEMSKDFSALLSKNQIIKMLTFHLMGQLMVNKFAVYFFEDDYYLPIINRFDFEVEDDILIDLKKKSSTMFLPKYYEHSEISQVSVVSSMMIQGKCKGLMLVGRKLNNTDFTKDNLKFIEALGNTAIASFENERLFLEELEKKKMESELNIAKEIQQQLLPLENPTIQGFQVVGKTIPSRQVGGDYYDFIQLDPHRYLITIADVSGKGMPASLIMASLQSALKVLAPLDLDLKSLISRLNLLIYENTTSDKFVTLFFGILDSQKNTFSYLNAGHNPPYLCSNGELHKLVEGGLILGFLDSPFEYETGEVTLKKDDIIVMFTDGVTEAANVSYEEYSEERLEYLLLNNCDLSAELLMENIFNDVNKYAEGTFQSDDITAVVIKAE